MLWPQAAAAASVRRRRQLSHMQGRAVATRCGPERRARASLWLPTTAIFTVLAPFALMTLPFLYLAPRRVVPDPLLALLGVGRLLLSLSGTDIDVDTAEARVRLRFF